MAKEKTSVDFDLSILSLDELLEVYENIEDLELSIVDGNVCSYGIISSSLKASIDKENSKLNMDYGFTSGLYFTTPSEIPENYTQFPDPTIIHFKGNDTDEEGFFVPEPNVDSVIVSFSEKEDKLPLNDFKFFDLLLNLKTSIFDNVGQNIVIGVSGSFDDVKGEILLKLANGKDIVIPFDVLADLKKRSGKAFSEASLDKSNQLVLSSPDGSQKKVDLSPLAFGEAARTEIEKLKETDASFERRLTNLEEQISDDYFVTDDAVAYEKIVPARACTYAKLNSLGGMSYKCDNLLDYRKFNATHTDAGVTLTNNGDGTLTFSGTLAVDSYGSKFPIFEGECYIPAGTYTLSGLSELPGVAYIEFVWVYASGEADATSNLGAVTFTENVVDTVEKSIYKALRVMPMPKFLPIPPRTFLELRVTPNNVMMKAPIGLAQRFHHSVSKACTLPDPRSR